MDAAAAFMASDWREQTFFGSHRLRFEYARRRQPGPADDGGQPTCTLRVAGLQAATNEEELRFAFVPHAPGE